MNKIKIFIGFGVVLTSVCLTFPARAGNPEHLKQLRETKQCAKCDLSGVDLSGADLSFAVLVGANLSGANLKGANLSNADLTGANLTACDLSGANLNQAYLTNANLHQTKFIGASLGNTRGLPIMTAIAPFKPLPLPNFNLPPSTQIQLPALPPIKPTQVKMPSIPALSTLSTIPPLPKQPLTLIPPKKTANSQSPNPYPEKIKQAFLSGCTSKLQPEMQSTCSCMIDKVEKEYTLGEFLEISLELAEGEQPPARFLEIALECGTQPPSAISLNLPK